MSNDYPPVPPPRPAIPVSSKPAERTPLTPDDRLTLDAALPKRKKRKKSAKQIVNKAARDSGQPKNPNRPLEMKNRLAVVLEMARVLRKPDLVVFTDLMDRLQALHRGARKKVLDGLNRVFT